MLKEIKNSLEELGFYSNEIKVYIALTQLGEATASEVAKKADLPRTTAISILNKLKGDNYLTAHQYRGTTYYWIESPRVIVNIFENKIGVAKNLDSLLTDLYRSEAHFPSAQIFDTQTGIKKFIEKTLSNLKKKTLIYTIDTPGGANYAKIYPENVEKMFLKIKKERQILTNTLVPCGCFGGIAEYKIKNQNIMIREMPAGVDFGSSFWIIDDIIVHFSGNPPFVAAIKHGTIVKSMKSVYDFLWSISSPKN
jgi:sugar-specific transcriptional regulator TrmB